MVVVSESEMEEEQQQSETEESATSELPSVTETEQERPTEEVAAKAKKKGGRRAALRLIRESVEHVSKELTSFKKGYESMSGRRDKQLQAIRGDIAALKSVIAKEAAKAKKSQDALASKILSKLKAPKPAKKSVAKKRKSKGKK